MRTAGAIIRVSTTRQLEQTSHEKQLEAIQALALDQGFLLEDPYIWTIAESGSLRGREGFQAALRAAESSNISRVYVFNVDRLGRDLLEMLLFLRDLDDRGIECWEAERRRSLAWDDFMLQVEGAVAGKERREILRRSKDGIERTVKAGKYVGGIVAYGYRVNPETQQLESDEDESAVVRLIFDWCTEERLSTTQIAKRLNAMGIPTHYQKDGRKIKRKGKRSQENTAGIWRAGGINRMLKNRSYIGEWSYGKRSKSRGPDDLIPGYCPAIISEEQFKATRRVLTSNRYYRPEDKRRKNLLRSLIRCENCDSNYVGYASKVASGERRYYRCNRAATWRRYDLEPCGAKTIRSDDIESVVWDDIKAFVGNPGVAINQLRAQKAPVDETLGEQLQEVESQIQELKRQELNLLKIHAESSQVDISTLDKVLLENRENSRGLIAYRDSLKSRLDSGEALEEELFNIANRLSKLQDRIDDASFEEKRRAVEELVKGISVETQEVGGKKKAIVTITYRFKDPGYVDPSEISYVPEHTHTDSSHPRA